MNFAPFAGHAPAAAAMPTIHQFAAKFGYEGGGGAPFPGDKCRAPESLVVVSGAPAGTVTLAGIAPLHTVSAGVKYEALSAVNVGYAPAYVELKDKRERDELPHDLMAVMQHQVAQAPLPQGAQQLLVVVHEPREAAPRAVKQEGRAAPLQSQPEFISIGDVSDAAWQLGGVADFLSLPLHLLKCDKREEPADADAAPQAPLISPPASAPEPPPKRKKKKKAAKEKKPRPKPGEIRLTTALDGSTLYCCPECHMAYPERGLLDQHLLGHTMERRFICDICNAALKRKDHLTRHKQSHNSARPHACSVCLKAFKRKEQLTLHFVIHSGEKRHVCGECGKGFYRKDHLRKHTRSHIARRVKAELSQAPEPS